MPTPTLFLDFDGVLNFSASRTAYLKNKTVFGYLRRNDVYVTDGSTAGGWASPRGSWFTLNYSSELVRKLNSLKDATNFTFLWLTTWTYDAVKLVDPALGTKSDGFLPWDPHSGVTLSMTDAAIADVRDNRKYDALKASIAADPRPFVWVDDSATRLFNAADFTVPSLVVRPDENFGLTKPDFDAVVDFFTAHKLA